MNVSSAGTNAGINIKSVSHEYRPPQGRPVLALDQISLEVQHNEFLAILGPSGCGKSTLLYLLGGFLEIQKGEIHVGGKLVTEPGPDRGVVFQHFALFPWKTVRENILYGLEVQKIPKEERISIAETHIELVGLTGFGDSYPSQLSGGMQQRVAIARALAMNPDTLLMDEPFGALDAQTRGSMHEELLSILSASPKTVVFITHDVREAVLLADRVAVMGARPGTIKEIIGTRFEADSLASVVRGQAYLDAIEYIWNKILEESAVNADHNQQ